MVCIGIFRSGLHQKVGHFKKWYHRSKKLKKRGLINQNGPNQIIWVKLLFPLIESASHTMTYIHKWRHSPRGEGASRILWQQYLSHSTKMRDDGGRWFKNYQKLRDFFHGRPQSCVEWRWLYSLNTIRIWYNTSTPPNVIGAQI
jgi:hypothetical protein